MKSRRRATLLVLVSGIALLVAAATGSLAADTKPHRVAIQVNQNDPAVMNLALNNASNVVLQGQGRDGRHRGGRIWPRPAHVQV